MPSSFSSATCLVNCSVFVIVPLHLVDYWQQLRLVGIVSKTVTQATCNKPHSTPSVQRDEFPMPDTRVRRLRVGHGHPVPSDERRFYDLHRPFKPGWPVCVVQRPFVSGRWKALTGQKRKFKGFSQADIQ